MAFFEQAITVLQTLVIALGAGLGIWGVINLLEGYGNDNPGAKSQGMKQLMAGAGVAVVAWSLYLCSPGFSLSKRLRMKSLPLPQLCGGGGKEVDTVWISYLKP